MSNYQRMVNCLIWAISFAVMGVPIGLVAGLVLISVNPDGDYNRFLAVGACGVSGAVIFGALPCIPALWFLILHMIGQVSSAIRDGERQ